MEYMYGYRGNSQQTQVGTGSGVIISEDGYIVTNNHVIENATELEITLNPKVKKYSSKNKIYPKGRSTMGLPGTRAQKGKKKWKQIK